jgi:GT2 family glycosyltransferase
MDKPDQYTLLVPQFPHGPWSCNLAEARESIVMQALQNGCSHLLMCDTDQTYPADTLAKLAAHDVPVCGVRVHRRYPPFEPIFMRGNLDRYERVPEEEMYSGKLIEVDATGTGCLLINMSIFDSIPAPWFKFDEHKGRPVGEDFYFCNKVRKAGFRIFVDTSVEVGHLATIEVNRFLHQICKQIPRTIGG